MLLGYFINDHSRGKLSTFLTSFFSNPLNKFSGSGPRVRYEHSNDHLLSYISLIFQDVIFEHFKKLLHLLLPGTFSVLKGCSFSTLQSVNSIYNFQLTFELLLTTE